jgi:hypothetical protein
LTSTGVIGGRARSRSGSSAPDPQHQRGHEHADHVRGGRVVPSGPDDREQEVGLPGGPRERAGQQRHAGHEDGAAHLPGDGQHGIRGVGVQQDVRGGADHRQVGVLRVAVIGQRHRGRSAAQPFHHVRDPVGEPLVVRAALHLRRVRRGGQFRLHAAGQRPVGRADLVHQELPRHPVEHDVVHGQHEQRAAGEADHLGPRGCLLSQLERRVAERFHEALHLVGGPAVGDRVGEADLGRGPVGAVLDAEPGGVQPEPRAQRVMASQRAFHGRGQ